ncbi:general stress protein [Arthrobacter sp. H14]|uniref:general stress protein n=1 Tax=Arthrobacter sp. H14 TaxID=1312959 RepID=UPI001C1E310C|nr:general stress protein [Arthrobacter sp. H14]
MSNMLGQTNSRDQTRTLPRGETVGTYAAYLDAQKAVDYLADQQFPVQNVSILGNDLKTVERVTGRLSYPRVALAGAATGAWFGLFVGVALMLFGGTEAYTTLLSSMALGAGFWMLFGVITYALQRGKRDFTSTSQVVASNYQVIVVPEAAGEARRLLQQLPMNGQQAENASGGYGPRGNAGQGQGYGQGGQYGGGQGGQYGGGQQGHGQGGTGVAGQPPERPAGWEDPYQNPQQGQQGNQPPQYGQGNQGNQPPQYGQGNQPYQPGPQGSQDAPAGQQPRPEQQSEAGAREQAAPRGRFRDLPDGRPQYGERLPMQNEPAGSGQPAAAPAQPQATPPSTPSQPAPGSDNRSNGPAYPESQPTRPQFPADEKRPDASGEERTPGTGNDEDADNEREDGRGNTDPRERP